MINYFNKPFTYILQSNNLLPFALSHFSIAVKTQGTPNPNFVKFMPGKDLLKEGESFYFTSIRQAENSSLAKKLFNISGVNKIFYGKDYISVGKQDMIDWDKLKPMVINIISDHFSNNSEVFDKASDSQADTAINENDSESVAMIKEIISARIRPVLQEDGGDIKYLRFDEKSGIVYLQMKGACSGCPSSSMTLKGGIEKMLIHYVANVKGVEAVDE